MHARLLTLRTNGLEQPAKSSTAGCENKATRQGRFETNSLRSRHLEQSQSLALHPEEERIDGGVYGGCVIHVEQRVGVPVNVTLVDDAAGKVFLPRRIASGEDAVEVFADSHQVI